MKEKILLIINILLLFILSNSELSFAQSIQQIKADTQTYLYGEGAGITEQAADDAALNDLIRKISVTVKGDFTSKEREETIGRQFSSETTYESIIKTYSSATLNNTERILLKHEPDAKVFRFIKKTEIDRIFKSRAEKALEFVRLADIALSKTQIDDALRYYYWALCLVRSLRYPNELKIAVDDREQMLCVYLLSKIDEVCSDVKISTDKQSDGLFYIQASYKDKPVRSMDYTYNDGSGFGAIYSIRDGKGVIETNSAMTTHQIQMKLEYEFRGMAVTDREVDGVISSYSDIFKHAYLSIILDEATLENKPKMPDLSDLHFENLQKPLMLTDKDLVSSYKDRIQNIIEALSHENLLAIKNLFTDVAFDELKKILGYGRYKITKDQQLQYFSDELNGNVVCRGLQCIFYFSGNRTFNEQLSFSFSEGKISHVALGLGKQMAEEEIFDHNSWGESSRHKIIAFLEDYRTAYAMKDLQYMENVFDDNAVIIVGNMKIVRAPMLNDKSFSAHTVVTRTRYNKQQFIQHLRATFSSKEYVNLHFSNCEIVKLGDKERYGIQVKQDYYSSNYGDSGYLYLLVDLTDPEKPIIHVRTWQEAPDPEFGIIGPGNF